MSGRGGGDPDAMALKLASLLAQYPDEAILAAREEILAAADGLPQGPRAAGIRRFLRHWSETSGEALAAEYVETFDLHRRTSPYLTYHVYGDTRQRGMAMVRLRRLYAAAGMDLQTHELPDHLPIVLEFAAFAPSGYGAAVLRELRPSLELMRQALRDRGSPYADLLDAVCDGLPRMSPSEWGAVRRLAAEGPPVERVGLEPFAPPEVVSGEGARP